MNYKTSLSTSQTFWLVFLRLVIGWHFLYEGLIKVTDPSWSSRLYLLDSQGPFSSIFYAIAQNSSVLAAADFLNQWGLLLIGLGMVLGILSRWACYAGMLLLAFYYLSHPPFIGLEFSMPTEGNYFLIDKIAIEIVALGVLSVFPTDSKLGLGRFFSKKH